MKGDWSDDPDTEYWYRYEDQAYCAPRRAYEGDEEWSTTTMRVELRKLRVLKTTACGVWIEGGKWDKRFVRESDGKYAHRTVEEARASYLDRKRGQIRIVKEQLRRAEHYLSEAQAGRWVDDGSWA